MFTLAQLKAAVYEQAFPDGQAKNLVVSHGKIVISALIEIQQAIERYKHNNTLIVPFCATLFQCGMTVIEAPRGSINRVSTFSGISSDCLQEAANINWCDEVIYRQVIYTDMIRMIDRTLACNCSGFNYNSLLNMSQFSCQKVLGQKYPPPTDAEYCNFPSLPLGFHFAQAATDLSRRARMGVWALYHNRLYVAPWINSSETIVIEYDGLKRQWVDADWVDTEEDPLLIDAVKHYLLMKHFGSYERDPQMEAYHKAEYFGYDGKVGAAQKLFHQFREETRERNVRDQNSHAMMSGKTLQEQSQGVIECETTSTTTTTTTTCALPTPPFNLGVSEDTNPNLLWDVGDGTGDQEIWRSKDGGDYELLETVPVDAFMSVDTSGDSGVLCYKVRGQNACGYSEFCSPRCVVI